MTEAQIRQKVVAQMQAWIGCKEADGSHKKIIDLYNSHKPLARNYAVKYTDAWCATTVSAASIACNLTDIMPTECGCGAMINLYMALKRWEENDAYRPQPGDVIFYDWDDGANYASTDNKGYPEHVGIVEKVNGSTITVIEGNKSDAVGRRTIQVNGRYIRGYGLPDFASKATASGGSGAPAAKKTTDEIAREVIDGRWGSGENRKALLKDAGYDYNTIQARVNELLGVKPSSGSGSASKSFAVGDKVKVTGQIYAYGTGKGNSIKKSGDTMYVVGLVDAKTYKHNVGVAKTKGGTRQGWAAPDILTKI